MEGSQTMASPERPPLKLLLRLNRSGKWYRPKKQPKRLSNKDDQKRKFIEELEKTSPNESLPRPILKCTRIPDNEKVKRIRLSKSKIISVHVVNTSSICKTNRKTVNINLLKIMKALIKLQKSKKTKRSSCKAFRRYLKYRIKRSKTDLLLMKNERRRLKHLFKEMHGQVRNEIAEYRQKLWCRLCCGHATDPFQCCGKAEYCSFSHYKKDKFTHFVDCLRLNES